MKLVIFIFLFVFIFSASKGQTIYTTQNSGDWNTASTWNANGIPPTLLSNNNVVNVDHAITSGNVTIGSNQTITLNINANTTLTSLTFNGSGTVNVFVANGVTFSAGSIANINNSTTTINGDISTTGDLRVERTSLTVTGELNVDGNVDIINNSTLNLFDANIGGNLTMPNGELNIDRFVQVNGDASISNIGSNINISDPGVLLIDGLLSMDNADILGSGVIGWGSLNMQNNANFQSLGNQVTPPYNPYDLDGNPANLPVTLLNFSARKTESGVQLNWITSSEQNFDYFSLQRSDDGINYIEIAQIKGQGNSKTNQYYQYNDSFPLSGTSYYRLQSIDFDGYTEIFRPVSISIKSLEMIQVFPNPVFGTRLTIRLPSYAIYSFTLKDLTGRTLFVGIFEGNRQSLDFSNYLQGIYLLNVEGFGTVKIIRN